MKTGLYQFLKTAFVGVFALLYSLSLQAQDRRITGTVTSGTDPVPGANIVIKGTTIGTSTDANGAFTLTLRGTADVLTVSAIGYKSTDVTVGSQTALAVQLQEEASTLNEVVVTGYSTDSKRDNTGSVSTVKARDLAAVPSANVETQLQGRIAGVTVIASGQPGANNVIRVRGFGAFGGNQPLYVVDGVPISGSGGINFLSPDDIESTTVLKDAAAASIYGARAASGVIVITTKRGQRKAQKLSVSYDALYGFTDPGKAPKVLNPQQQADWTWNAVRNRETANGEPVSFTGIANGQYGSGATPVLPDYLEVPVIGSDGKPSSAYGVSGTIDQATAQRLYNVNPAAGSVYQLIKANKQGTDWYGAVTRVAPLLRQTLGFSGGTESSRYYLSLGMQTQAGILLNNNFSRYQLRANTEFDITKRLRFGENVQLTYINTSGQVGGSAGQNLSQEESDILTAFRIAPIIPIYDEFGGYAGTAAKGFNNPTNPVASREGQKNNRNFNVSGFGNAYLEYDVIDNLTLRSSIGGQFGTYYNKTYGRRSYENAENNGAFQLNEGSGYSLAWTFTNTAQYKRRFGIHSIDVLGGIEALNTGTGRDIGGQGLNPFSTDPAYVNLATTSSTGRTVTSDLFSGVNFYSQFARVNYSLLDKYIVTGVIRRDGSSRFGANNRYGVFPGRIGGLATLGRGVYERHSGDY